MKDKIITFFKTPQVTLALQAIVSLVFIVLLFILNVLPTFYLVVVAALLALLWILAFSLQVNAHNKSLRAILSRIMSVIISALLVLGCTYITRTNSFINTISKNNYQVNSFSVIVLKDSPVNALTDLNNKNLSINVSYQNELSLKAISDLEKTIQSPNWSYASDMSDLGNSLYEGKVDAIVLNEAYRNFIQDDHSNFDNETRIIETISLDQTTSTSGKNIQDGVFNIYISGIDTYGNISTVSRTDVNMVLSVNMNTHKMIMTSIPRDTYVPLAKNNQYDKLTHSGIYGVDESVATIENFLGVPINYYVRVNFSSLITVVDALGGVDVYSDKDLTLDGHHYSIGNNHLDGAAALRFARERHSYSTGDAHRTENQQAVLEAIINKVASFNSVTNYNSILSAAEGAFNTNMPSSDITNIIKRQVDDMSGWTIEHQYITGTGGMTTGLYSMPNNKLYVLYPDKNSVSTCKQAIENITN